MFNEIKKYMKDNGIKAYVIPTADYHNSEYISPFFKQREVVSGFTGSAGTLLITDEDSYLWTDGRYFLQAEQELKHGIKLMRQGVKGTLSILEVLNKHLKENDTVCFSYKLMPISTYNYLTSDTKFKFIDLDIVSMYWNNRPSLPNGKIFLLPKSSYGLGYEEKLKQVKDELINKKCDLYLISALEDIAWLLNLRGSDVSSTPVFLSYFLITKDKTILYVDKNKLEQNILTYLNENNVIVKDYDLVYDDLKEFKDCSIYLDYSRTNSLAFNILKDKNKIVDGINITSMLKAVKNSDEIKSTINAHIKDGVALFKFWYQFNNLIKTKKLTEYDVSMLVLDKRKEQKDFLYPSFTTISAFEKNAAIMHYSPKKESSSFIEEGSFLLIDSGGQYIDGTTDITRTFAIGNISDKLKEHYTLVLQGVIDLSTVCFLEGSTGSNLDILARRPIWNAGIEYRCGTGHGVGHVLSVHEGPNSFRQNLVNNIAIKPGMITTCEPGIYLDNKYGIRLEQELLCVNANLNCDFGEFYKFQTITMFPFDLNAINVNMLDIKQKEWLNNYHKEVYNTLKDHLNKEEQEFLKYVTRQI